MEIEIISFGQLAEFIENQRMNMGDIRDTDELKRYLEARFPMLAESKYKLALNKIIVNENLQINNNDTLAIMPPFSGG